MKKLLKFLDGLGHPDDPRDIWIADKEAEYRMNGLDEKEAKRKAMEDWHTYQSPNVE